MVSPSVATLTYASTDDLRTVADLLTGILGLTFELHSSDWRGGDYLLAGDWRAAHAEQVYVQPNDDLGESAEPECARYPTLIYIECTRRADQLQQDLAASSLVLVRREDWSDPSA